MFCQEPWLVLCIFRLPTPSSNEAPLFSSGLCRASGHTRFTNILFRRDHLISTKRTDSTKAIGLRDFTIDKYFFFVKDHWLTVVTIDKKKSEPSNKGKKLCRRKKKKRKQTTKKIRAYHISISHTTPRESQKKKRNKQERKKKKKPATHFYRAEGKIDERSEPTKTQHQAERWPRHPKK